MKEKVEKLKNRLKKKQTDKDKKQNENKVFLSKKGVHKFVSTCIIETLYIFIIELLFKLLLGTLSFDYSLLRIFLSSSIFAFGISCITVNMNAKVRKTILLIFNFIMVFYPWLQMGFLDYLGTFISLGSAGQGAKITDYIGDFLVAYDWKTHLIFIPFILSVIFYIFESRILKDGYLKKIKFKSLKTCASLITTLIVLVGLFVLSISVNFMQNKYQTVSNYSLFKNPFNPSLAIKNFGTSLYFALDIKNTAFGGADTVYASGEFGEKAESKTREIDDTAWEKLIEKEEDATLNLLNNYFIHRDIPEKNEYTGIFKDKNLIFIMLESISQAVFDEEYKEYFPTLYKLYSEGMTGVNNYSPKNNCATGESEMTSQISLYSIETTCTVNTYKQNIYPEALMYMLKENGYYTSAYHNYTEQYYYRKTIELNFGSENYYDVNSLGIPYSPLYKEWPSDLSLMEKALPKFIDKEKFASYMITVSAHTPYAYSSKLGDKHLDLFQNIDLPKATKRYLSKVKETDLALEYLLKELENRGILEDTVLVIFGDHYPYGLGDKAYADLANYDVSTNQEIDRTPFIIYNSGQEAKKITKITTPLDYTPTILNLLGIEYDPRHYMGNDVFSDYTDFALFPDNSWQTSSGYYDAKKGEFIPKEGQEETMTDEEIIVLNQKVNDLRNMSGLAIKKNYFKYLYQNLERYISENEENSEDTEPVQSTEKGAKKEE